MVAPAAALAQLAAIWAAHSARISRSMFAVALPAAVLFFGHFAAPSSFLRSQELTQSLQWCIITLVIVPTPTIGQTAKKGMERAFGTIAGGTFGLAAVSTGSMAVQWLGIIVAAGFGDIVVSHFKRENAGRLLPVTYIIVTSSALHHNVAWQVAVSRTTAILFGIAICFVLSVTWAPQAASNEAYRQLLAMLEAVTAMAQHSWELLDQGQPQQQGDKADVAAAATAAAPDSASVPAGQQPAARVTSSGSKQQLPQPPGELQLPVAAGMPAPRLPPPSAQVQLQVQGTGSQPGLVERDAAELAMRRFLEARNKLKDSLATAAAEYLLGYACGRPVIVPALVGGATATASSRPPDGHHVPAKQLSAVAISLRHCCHSWWMLHKLLLDGLDGASLEAITTSRYPADMLSRIRSSSVAVLQQAAVCVQDTIAQSQPCCAPRWRHHKPPTSMQQQQQQQQQQPGSSQALHCDAMAAFGQLEEHMADLRTQLATWTQIFLAVNTLKRQAIEQLQAGGSGAEALQLLAAAAPGAEPHVDAAAAASLYVTPSTPEAHLFMLQWHALHYILVQLERGLEDLRSDLLQLLLALLDSGPAAADAASS